MRFDVDIDTWNELNTTILAKNKFCKRRLVRFDVERTTLRNYVLSLGPLEEARVVEIIFLQALEEYPEAKTVLESQGRDRYVY